MKKIVVFIASGRKDGNSSKIVNEIVRGAIDSNSEAKIYYLTDMRIEVCHGCFYCRKNEHCWIKDDIRGVIKDISEADAVIFSTPIYMFQISGQAKILLDRLYPLLSGEAGRYELKYGTKRTIAVYSQGSPNSGSFQDYITHNNKSLGLLGFNVEKTIICTNANDINSVKKNNDLLDLSYQMGNELCL